MMATNLAVTTGNTLLERAGKYLPPEKLSLVAQAYEFATALGRPPSRYEREDRRDESRDHPSVHQSLLYVSGTRMSEAPTVDLRCRPHRRGRRSGSPVLSSR